METGQFKASPRRRLLDDFILAEIFLVQAGIESAMSIGDGLEQIARKFDPDAEQEERNQSLSAIVQRTASAAVEPYTSRLQYLKLLQENDR